MDDFFDSFESCTYNSEVLNKEQQNINTNAKNDQQIIKQLCLLTDESNQLRKEIDSLNDDCNGCNKNQFSKSTYDWNTTNDNCFKLKEPPDINEILSIDETTITSTPHNVGVINSACQQVLKEIEQQLLSSLKKNRIEQEIVTNFLSTNGKYKASESVKKVNLKCMGIPYFKDLDGYPPPQNHDELLKKRKNELLPIAFLDCSAMWNNSDAKNLIIAVNNFLRSLPEETHDVNSIDWLKISVTDMDGKYSPTECKSKWILNLNPKVNKSKWGLKETKLLNKIAEKFNYQDWPKIAEELGTNRTDLQCCVQYHTQRCTNGRKWTAEEDEKLKKLIEMYKVKDFIPWSKVTWHFEDRSLRQCEDRYYYHLGNIKKGVFSAEEDLVLVYLATKLKNFGEVSKYFPKRVSTQIRSRYEYLVKISMPEFTKEEDELLTNLMALYPRNWGKISEHFKKRSKLQCRKRWSTIQKNIKLDSESCTGSDSEEPFCVLNNEITKKNETKTDMLDTANIKKNLCFSDAKKKSTKLNSKEYSTAYSKLLEYLKHCHKFLFGPKCRIPSNSEDLLKLCIKMRVTMKTLSISPHAPLNSFDLLSLSKNCNFDYEDNLILSELSSLDSSNCNNAVINVSNNIIPPNYMTLVGLRTLTLFCSTPRNSSYHTNFLPNNKQLKDENTKERILFCDAKILFKSRIRALFALPIILSNVAQELKPVCKPKKKTNKPLSKKKRKEHAKFMSEIYRSQKKKDVKNVNELGSPSSNSLNVRKNKMLQNLTLMTNNDLNVESTLTNGSFGEISTRTKTYSGFQKKRRNCCKNEEKLILSKKSKVDKNFSSSKD